MPKSLTPTEADEVAQLLIKCEQPDVADRLTDWERDFIESVTEQFANTNWLSPEKQIPKLRQIVEGDSGTSRENRRAISRPKKLSYGSGEAAGPPSGGFSGFGGKGPENQSGSDD